jgi:hypothetical protein
VPERQKTVFISCGQYAPEENDLGKLACELVEEITPFKAYFAEYQTTLKALSENVLSRLYESVGLIVIMRHRGKIEGREISRALVWIEQEIAIATMMEQVVRRPLHVALFIQPGISIEGIRQQLQLNPVEFMSPEDVTGHLRKILPKWTEPLYVGDQELRTLVDSVYLSIAVQNGNKRDLTIGIQNHSDVDVKVKSIVLWSKDKRVSTDTCVNCFCCTSYNTFNRSRSRWLNAIRSVSMGPSATHESGHFRFAQTGHSHFAATLLTNS